MYWKAGLMQQGLPIMGTLDAQSAYKVDTAQSFIAPTCRRITGPKYVNILGMFKSRNIPLNVPLSKQVFTALPTTLVSTTQLPISHCKSDRSLMGFDQGLACHYGGHLTGWLPVNQFLTTANLWHRHPYLYLFLAKLLPPVLFHLPKV